MRFGIAGPGSPGAVIARQVAEAGHDVVVSKPGTTSRATVTPNGTRKPR
jgi:H2-forming N5,N10-methylenetetrahydromethanopterin dehydrogenase-like enzyme